MPYERTEIVQPSGIVSDLSPFEMPPEIWSSGENINFRRGRTNGFVGDSNPYGALAITGRPVYLQWFDNDGTPSWIYATYDTIYTTGGVSVAEIGTGYGAARDVSWTGCDFNAMAVLNNRADHPVQILAPYTTAEPLDNWASTSPWGAASRCEVMRPYKNYLIAMDCYDEAGTRYPNMVRWSSPAQLGEPPVSWDASIVGEQAGLYPLADTQGRVVDGLTLGDYFVVYKTDAVWLMQFIGGDFTMKFRKLFGGDTGILAKDCVAEFEGKHFVLAPNTCYVHNGATKQDVMDGWVKDEFFNTVSSDYISETKVVADRNNNEILVYYISKNAVEETLQPIPTIDGESASSSFPAEDEIDGGVASTVGYETLIDGGGADQSIVPYADRALVWNWVEKTWTRRPLNGISYISEGYVQPVSPVDESWDADTQSWNDDRTRWNGDINFNTVLEGLLMARFNSPAFLVSEYPDGTELFKPSSWVKRIGIDFNNDRRFKMVERVVPHINGQSPVTITIFASDVQTTVPTIEAVTVFDPAVDQDIDCHVVGRYIGIMFECDELFTLNGYTIEWKPTGNF